MITFFFLFFSVTTRFCREWAKTMLSDAVDNPVFLRQVIENYKLRVCEERLDYNPFILNLNPRNDIFHCLA